MEDEVIFKKYYYEISRPDSDEPYDGQGEEFDTKEEALKDLNESKYKDDDSVKAYIMIEDYYNDEEYDILDQYELRHTAKGWTWK